MINDHKYVVFKRKDWDSYMNGGPLPQILTDATVIRGQDVFAPPALDAYSNAILCTVEALTLKDAIETPLVTNLRKVSEYFHERAVDSWNTNRKFPD